MSKIEAEDFELRGPTEADLDAERAAQSAAEDQHEREQRALLELPVMDEEDAMERELRSRLFTLIEYYDRVLQQLHAHAPLPVECMAFITHRGWLFGIQNQKDIAQRYGHGPEAKANVNKYVKTFQREVGMPPVECQRTAQANANMHAARNRQLR